MQVPVMPMTTLVPRRRPDRGLAAGDLQVGRPLGRDVGRSDVREPGRGESSGLNRRLDLDDAGDGRRAALAQEGAQ